ncbi:MAG: 30S ribosomal protein S20 [Verrucomicrobiota bacterium]|jgi:small subunit ribosomal protein S20|nr:30S ribosomal protein S20 [Verrucomicrobiota bacterium]MDD8047808.1 30S ribosomal protein S20 [Verrucomicrobiota bacterium]MDD8052444.1 30S ribosomal protein S20 [Verrucomicrobiota bacterium]MDI9383605.1 30S ribosomal protein S20 [Verrucomicrobiota bacterium]
MPNTKSATKRLRSDARKRNQNRIIKSRLHTVERSYLKAVETGNAEAAEELLRKTISLYDKAAKVGTIHGNKADRKKARLGARLKTLASA